MHTRIATGISGLDRLKGFHIPHVYYYVNAPDDKRWKVHERKFPVEPQGGHCNVHCTARILPLPEVTRYTLIDTSCPDRLKEKAKAEAANKDCLARVYIEKWENKHRSRSLMFLPLRSLNLCLNQLQNANVPGLEDIARLMDRALVVMHWKIGIDADDVEVVSWIFSTELRPLFPFQVSNLARTYQPERKQITFLTLN
ncbi:hypothetical protein K432DRAFT_463442 [Lepidopterella palustris CBS 459.81]|uniref:DUF3669 domain-containing protein n=1 Tax=Lepidopterella palustris CBS 459.81 TaxID=1314670 RepID=A0A8E2E2X9_9PEZI|nr:hypothetical protein K432DRAFT_463442 [Lepidopterella palustris CBS 459.81]